MKNELHAQLATCVRSFQAQQGIATRWRQPLLGVASAADPLFEDLRVAVRASHAMPTDLLADARSVVAFFLPFDPRVGASNRGGRLASVEWARAYVETNELIGEINARLGSLLQERGHSVCVTPATHNYDAAELMSDWSHRHVAYVAGLGTFGMNNMLITERGCCGRLGSLVTSAELEPDRRPVGERCINKRDGSCLICAERCVGAALVVGARFDRHRCHEVLRENARVHAPLGKADACGKCVVKLPCSHTVPKHG